MAPPTPPTPPPPTAPLGAEEVSKAMAQSPPAVAAAVEDVIEANHRLGSDGAGGPRRAKRRLPPHSTLIFATFLSHVCTFGPLYSLGVFVPALKESFDVELDVASSMVSFMFAMQFFGSLLAGVLIPGFLSHRTVAGAGAVIVLTGYVCASFADGVWAMHASLGLFVGLGLGACNLAGLTALNARVKERRALAVGLATTGTTVGAMAMPPACAAMIAALGWRWALRLFGIASGLTLLAVAPCFLVPTGGALRIGAASSGGGSQGAAGKAAVPQSLPPVAAAAAGASRQRLSRRLAKLPCVDLAYLCWWLNMLLCFFGYFAPLTLLAQFAEEELGLEPELSAMAYTFIGLFGCFTRVSLGCLTKLAGGARRVHFVAQASNGVMAMLLPFCWSGPSLLAWAALFGLTVGPVIALISVILAEVFGVERLPLNHGFSRFAVGLGAFAGPPIVSRLVVAVGYRAGFVAGGGCVLGATLFLGLMARCEGRRLLSTTKDASAEFDGTAAGSPDGAGEAGAASAEDRASAASSSADDVVEVQRSSAPGDSAV